MLGTLVRVLRFRVETRQGPEFKSGKAEQAPEDRFEKSHEASQILQLCAGQEGLGGNWTESKPLLSSRCEIIGGIPPETGEAVNGERKWRFHAVEPECIGSQMNSCRPGLRTMVASDHDRTAFSNLRRM
jgi:hypothetical protein